MKILPAPLLFIADPSVSSRPLPLIVAEALQGGCRWILYRDTESSFDQKLQMGGTLVEQTRRHNAQFFVSRDSQLAEKLNADGLHLKAGQKMPEGRTALSIGQSCHNAKEIEAAIKAGVDYITLSPIFLSPSKPDYGPALGLEKLQQAVNRCPLPLVALGGINADNAKQCLAAGASAIAIMGAILNAENAEKMVSQCLENLKTA